MKDDILTYINTTLPYELQVDIKRSIDLFDLFEIEEYQDNLSNLLMSDDNSDPAQTQDSFLGIIKSTIDFILINHTLILNESSFSNYNEILSSLYILQDLYDYTTVEKYLIEDEDSLTRISKILALYCNLSPVDIMLLIKDYDYSLLSKIKEIADNSKGMVYQPEVVERIINIVNIEKAYSSFSKLGTLAIRLLNKGFKPNYEFRHYLPFIKDDILATDPDNIDKGIDLLTSMVANIISLGLFSSDGYEAFLAGEDKFKNLLRLYLADMVPNVTENLINKLSLNIDGFYGYMDKESSKEKVNE